MQASASNLGPKVCKDCGEEKPRTTDYWFRDRRVVSDGLQARCKLCDKARKKAKPRKTGDRLPPAPKAVMSEELIEHRIAHAVHGVGALDIFPMRCQWFFFTRTPCLEGRDWPSLYCDKHRRLAEQL